MSEGKTARIFELDDYRKDWRAAWCRCALCGKRWVGVFRAATTALECPRCSVLSGKPEEAKGDTQEG